MALATGAHGRAQPRSPRLFGRLLKPTPSRTPARLLVVGRQTLVWSEAFTGYRCPPGRRVTRVKDLHSPTQCSGFGIET